MRRIRDLKDMLAGSVAEFGDKPAFLRKRTRAAYEPVSFRQFQADVNAFGTALLDSASRPSGRRDRRKPVCLGDHLPCGR